MKLKKILQANCPTFENVAERKLERGFYSWEEMWSECSLPHMGLDSSLFSTEPFKTVTQWRAVLYLAQEKEE